MLAFFFQEKLDQWTDKDLVDAFRKTQKERYFNELFQRYHPLVYGLCINYTKNRELSKDLTQEIFLSAYENILHTAVRNFDFWIYALAKNACLDQLEEQQNLTKKQEDWKNFKKSGENFMENEAVSRLIYEQALKKDLLIEQHIQLLSKEQQQCIRLFFLEKQSYKTIANQTGFSEKQVKSYIQNGKRLMKQRINRQIKDL